VKSGETSRTVEIHEAGDEYEISFDGQAYRVDSCRILNTTVRSVIVDGRSYEIGTVQDGDRIDVYIHGEIHPVYVYDEVWARAGQANGPARSGREEVQAPIPGSVVKVMVSEGETVPAGAPLLVLEAMKMQNELTTRQGGVVVQLKAAQGDTVATGQTLVVLEPKAGDGGEGAP
jgi:biotin carboxyl carrier protein